MKLELLPKYNIDGVHPYRDNPNIFYFLIINYKTKGVIIIEKLKVVEIFSGIGAWAKALKNLNIPHETLMAIEFDQKTVDAYNAIHGTTFKTTDVTQLNEKDVPDCDLICWSPPCQAFSVAGKQEGFGDDRGVLFFDGLRIIKEKQPKYAIMENVKGLTQKKFEIEFAIMLKELEKAGYRNTWKVVNAKDLNHPQNRERVFIVSIRNDIEQTFKFPDKQPLVKPLTDYLESDASEIILHNIYGGFKETSARVFEGYSPTIRTSAGGGHIPSIIVNQQAKVAVIDDTYKNRNVRVYESYSPAIRSTRKGFKIAQKIEDKYFVEKSNYKEFIEDNIDSVVGDDYFILRQMTTLEAFQLMGFTEQDYLKAQDHLNNKWHDGKDRSDTTLYKLAGNSIVVNTVEHLLAELINYNVLSVEKELELV